MTAAATNETKGRRRKGVAGPLRKRILDAALEIMRTDGLKRLTQPKVAAAAGKADAVRADVRDASRWRSAVEATEKWAKKRCGRFTLKQAKEVSRKSYRAEVMPDILKALVEAGKLCAETVFMPQAGADVIFYWHVDLQS